MATIRTALVIDLEGNVAGEVRKVNEALDVSGTQAEKTGGRFKSFFDRSVKGFQKVRETVFSLSGALAGIGIGAVVTRSLNEADKIQKLAIKLGDSAERISAMRHVAAGAGIDFDQMMTSWQRMGRRISEVATSDTGPAAEALERLKLSADSLASLPPTDQFLAIADAMTGIANAGERMDIAQAIFDSEGVANVQAMQQGAQGIVSAMEEAKQLGFVLTQQQVDQAAQANDAITRVTNALSGAVQRIATEFAPHIERLANALTSEEGLGAIRSFASGLGWVITNLDSIAKLVALVVSASYLPALIGLLLTPLGPVILAVTGLAAAFITFRDEISSAWQAVKNFEIGIGPFKVSIGDMVNAVKTYFADLGNAISERIAVWSEFAAKVSEAAEAIVGYVADMVTGIKAELVDRFKGIVDSIGSAVDSVTGFFKDMWDKVSGNSYVPDMVDGIRDEFSRLPDVMVDPAEEATSTVAGFFEDLGRKVGSTIRGILDGTTSLKDGLRGLVSDIGQMIQGRLIDSAVNGLFGLLPDNVQQFLGVGGGGSPGRYINGGGIGGGIGQGTGGGGGGGAGGLFSTGTIAKLGKEIGTAMGNGSGLWKGIATGVKNALTGVSSTAAGNLGFKGPGVMNYGSTAGASTAGSASSGAAGLGGASWLGGAIMAVAAFGAGLQEKSQMKKIMRARKEMMANFSPANFEDIGLDSTWIGTLEGVHENIDKIYAAVDGKLVEALKEAGAITGAIGLRMAVNGEHVHQLHGQVDKVRTALEGAKITGFSFAGSIETAIEKGNGLQVSIQGNAEIIRGALENAAQAGDLAFRNFQQTATGATAILTGDIGKWQRVMQEFVNTAVKAAVSGVGELGREAGSATEKFLALARAAASVPAVRSTPFGGRDGFAYGGVSRGPQLAWVSEGPYPVEAHVPMADGRHIPVRMSGPVPPAPASADLGPVVAELRQVRADLDRVVGRPITRTLDRVRRRAAATARVR